MRPADDGLSAKFIGFFRLVDACSMPGCPVCRCLIADSHQYLEALIYEQVNDPDTRRRLRAAWGFCNQHTWMLGEISDSAFGSAIIHEDMLRVVGQRFERRGRRRGSESSSFWRRLWRLVGRHRRPLVIEIHRRRPRCPACQERIAAEQRYVHVALRFAEDLDFERAYARSEGLCVPHALQAIAMGPAGPAEILIARTRPKWAAVRRALSDFVDKHDHQNTVPFTDADRTVSVRAFEALAGAAGVFGSDAQGTDQARDVQPARSRTAEQTATPVEDAAFERARLELRIKETIEQHTEVSGRAAALHYRLAQVAKDRNTLELNLNGERAANALAMRVVAELRAEVERLRADLDRARSGTSD
jgi:hypothetical protein